MRISRLGRFLLVLASFWCSFQDTATAESFSSAEHGYSLEYPAGWRASASGGRFAIYNFPSDKAARGAVLPEGGAAVVVLLPDQLLKAGDRGPVALTDWVALVARHQRVRARRDRRIETTLGELDAVELDVECCAVAPFQETVELCFEIGGRFFAASITYWQGDPNAERFYDTLNQVVRSLRVPAR